MPGLSRLLGVAVLTATGAVTGVLWWVVSAAQPHLAVPERVSLFGHWTLTYDTSAPRPGIIVAAILAAFVLAAVVAYTEHSVTLRARRTASAASMPLAPQVVMADTRGRFLGEPTVTVLVPAHNEESSLPATLASLRRQSLPPVRIVVVADNCTDATEEVARRAGAEVIASVDNQDKKAGALNQALARVLPDQGENDVVMVMDADTVLDPDFLRIAVERFRADRALMAVGGVFYGEPGHGLLGIFQRNEYVRYSREIGRRRGRVFVLTGTASLFRPRALRAVADARGGALPGRHGDVYDVAALTEDNELTVAIKSLGGMMTSPTQCTVETELMPTWRALWNQRLRWQRGALENIGAYGIRPSTLRYWAQQLGIGYGVFALGGYFLLLWLTVLGSTAWVWFTFWVGLGAVFVLERVATAWRAGWRGRLVAALVFPELFYDFFIQMVFVKGVLDMSLGREATWRHLSQTDTDVATERDRASGRELEGSIR